MEMGEADPEPMLHGDDFKLSVISYDEIFLSKFPNDEELAEELQLQEVLMSSTIAGRRSSSRPLCEICRRPAASTEDAQKAKCPHGFCSTCLSIYIDSELKRDVSVVGCPHLGCDAVLEPKPYQKILPAEVFDDRTIAQEEDKRGKKPCMRITHHGGDQERIISVDQLLKTAQGKDLSLHISIQGDYDREAVLRLVSNLPAALDSSGEGPDDPEAKELIKAFGESPDDPKEKQMIKFPYSKTELGQSSSALLMEEEVYCSICMEAKPLSKSFSIKSCSHIFCSSCLGLYISAKVEENLTSIGCPNPECKGGVLEPEMCRPIIPIEVFNRWGIALCESLLGSRKFYCPYRDCSALLVDDEEGGAITDSECPHCNRLFCAQCRVPWHAGIGCKEFQQLGEDERGREDLMLRELANSSKWQRCPQCRMYVERIDGCKFMGCRCGYCFCYVCASPMSKDNHFCYKCNG